MHTDEFDTAALLRKLLDSVERQAAEDEPEGSVEVLRTVSDTVQTSDSVSATSQAASSWDWSSSSEWGFSTW